MRLVRRLLIVLALLLPLLLIPPSSSASACASSTSTWSITATNYGLSVGTLHRTQTKCWNSGGLTSASIHVWYVNTSFGSAYGVSVVGGAPYLLYRDTGLYEYGQDLTIRDCFMYVGLFCGPTEEFRTVDQIWAPNLTDWHWSSPFCVTNACASHVRFTRTS